MVMIGVLAFGLIGPGMSRAAAADKVAVEASGMIYPGSTGGHSEAAVGRSPVFTGILLMSLLLAGASGWLFWRARLASGGSVPLRKLAIAETKSLGNRQYLVVASYEDKMFLLGVCPGRIEMLTPLDGRTQGKQP